MAITYSNKEIQISPSSNKLNVDVVYARPEDIIKLGFDLKSVKVTFVNGDLDLIFANGSVISLVSFATLAFENNAPKIYDNEGKQIFLENLLQQLQVLKPEDSILILANRDKHQLVQNDEQINKVIMATVHTGELEGGNPIAGVGEVSNPTSGLPSSIVDKTGNVVMRNLKNGVGDYLSTHYTTNLKGTSEEENILPGNTNILPQPSIIYNFLFGDKGLRGADSSINAERANYYAVQFGVGDSKDSSTQLYPIDMNNLGGDSKNKIFDAHAVDGKITRVMKLEYAGGIFPQSITISGIPDTKDVAGNKLFNLSIKSGGATKIVYNSKSNAYTLTQLDPGGKVNLWFTFNDTVADQNLNIKFGIVYFDPKTSEQRLMETYYDVGIRTVNQKSDLSLNSAVINKGASGLIVNADSSGSGNKIFIGGNVSNNFESRSGNNLVFSGGGDDIINLSGTAGDGKNVIYGSVGYNIITGSGGENNWLVYDNDKRHNKDFLQSDVIKDSYYNTMKTGGALQFYLGINRGEVLSLWDKLGVIGDAVTNIKPHYTSNFVYTYNSVTVIGDRNGGISITNIVGSKEVDIFNLYFHDVIQKVNICGGNANTIVASSINFFDSSSKDEVVVHFGVGGNGTITSKGSVYTFDLKSFDKITSKGSGATVFKISYDGSGEYRSGPVYFTGGSGKNVVEFKDLHFASTNGGIVFDADARYNSVAYSYLNNKKIDYFYNFQHIVGSKGNDLFLGSTNSKGYTFDGFEGDNNTLSYERSVGGVTFSAIDSKVYKVNSLDITDYDKYKSTADSFKNIKKLKLSNLDNVIIGSKDVNIGSDQVPLLQFGSSNNTIRYDLDASKIDSIIVDADSLKVKKNNTSEDRFSADTTVGSIRFIGSKGDDLFYSGFKYANFFDGHGGVNVLSYENAQSTARAPVNLIFDLLKRTVSKGSKVDNYTNIQKIIGGAGNDTFSLGSFDPTNSEEVAKINGIDIDGGGGKNIIQFTSVNIQNLDKNTFALTFDVEKKSMLFISKGKEINLSLDISKNIHGIYGTTGSDKFLASNTINYHYDGGGHSYPSNNIYGNTLDYTAFTTGITFDLIEKSVIKSESNKDTFLNIQAFYGGKGNDTFKLNNSLDDKTRYFDGGEGVNIIDYTGSFKNMFVNLIEGKITFGDQDKDKIDIFRNINTFIGGKGNISFLLAYEKIIFNDHDKDNFSLDGGAGINVLDFSNWGAALGVSNKEGEGSSAFELKTTGEVKTQGDSSGSIKYNWKNIQSFKGTKFSDSFIIKDEQTMYVLDGNKDTQGDGNILDYSFLGGNKGVSLNISTGTVEKGDHSNNNLPKVDSIKNIHFIKLTSKDDIVKFSSFDTHALDSLKRIDGGAGNNTVDYSQTNKDIEATIVKSGFDIKGGERGISFKNFNTIKASKGNSIFKVVDESNEAKVYLFGHVAPLSGKVSVLDLTQISNVNFWNIAKEDNPANESDIGKLTWDNNSKSANIFVNNINEVKLGKGKNTIYGSMVNFSNYIGLSGEENSIDYSNIADSIMVNISDVKQIVRLTSVGVDSYFTNFSHIIGTKNDDTFFVSDVDKIANNIMFDGNGGENTLSFIASSKGINIDISLERIKVGDKDLNIARVSKLVLTNHDDIVKITKDNANLLFDNINGSRGNNTFSVENNGVITFNEEGQSKVKISNIPNKEIKLLSFHNIITNASTGNKFFSSYGSGIHFKVIGSTDASINVLSYLNAASIVQVDFNLSTASKGDREDKFTGINYFYGSDSSTTFFLSKELKGENAVFSKIYINKAIEGIKVKDDNNDIISISKSGDGTKLVVSDRVIEGGKIKYEWYKVGTIGFANNQTVVASFDENYKYNWIAAENAKVENTTLIFDTTKSLKEGGYANGFVVIDVTTFKATTFDANKTQKAEVNFNGITIVVGTGNEKDMFYGGAYNIKFMGGEKSGKATLSYEKYAAQAGITVTFDTENGAKIEDSIIKTKVDTAQHISKYVGTTEDDTFIIANNKGKGKILIDGSGGVYNKVDYSNIAKGTGIILNTEETFQGDFDYGFTNISTFRLTQHNDTVLGSLTNKGFAKEGEKSASIIVDGGGGENTVDYSRVKGKDADKYKNIFNVDLQVGSISKSGFIDNDTEINTIDTIATREAGQIKINFSNIILSGNNTSNILIVSGGDINKTDTFIKVSIENATEGLKQDINFENVKENVIFTWNGNALAGTINGTASSYVGFNNIRLSSKDSTLIINKPTNMLEKGGSINGGDGSNTLKIDNKEAELAQIDLTVQKLSFSFKKIYEYSLVNFQNIELGTAKNIIYSNDIGNYSLKFTYKDTFNEVSYNKLSGTFTNIVINDITSNGAKATVTKSSITDATVKLGTDVLENVNNITLSNNDDTLNVKNNNTDVTINVDGGGGTNSVSFEEAWEGNVDIDSITGGVINVKGYKLSKFSKVILTKNNDNIKLKADSNIDIDGGGGTNSVDYTPSEKDPKFTQGIFATEYSVLTAGNVEKIGVRVMKEARYTDSLIRFNKFIFAQDQSNHYTALFVNQVKDSPTQFILDFNSTDNADKKGVVNVIDYSKLQANTTGIGAKITFGSGNNGSKSNIAEVTRNKLHASESISDLLIGINKIIGTNKGDVFAISTAVKNFVIDAGNSNTGELTLLVDSSDISNLFVWDLYNKTVSKGNVDNPLNVTQFLLFNGVLKILGLTKENTRIDNVYNIFNLNHEYIIVNNSSFSSKSLNTLDISNITINGIIDYNISISQAQGGLDLGLKSRENNKKITATGITKIVGSSGNQNIFNINLSGSADNVRQYYIIGRVIANSAQDTANISNNGSTSTVMVNGDSSLTFGGTGSINITFVKIPLFNFKGQGTYNFIFTQDSSGAILNLNSSDESNLYLDFSALKSDDFSLVLNKNMNELRSSKLNLWVKYNKINGFKIHEESEGSVVLGDVDSSTEIIYNSFSKINLINYHGNYDISISAHENNEALVLINKLGFTTSKNIEIIMNQHNSSDPSKGRVINLNINNFNQNLVIYMRNSDYNNKSIVNVTGYKETSPLLIQALRDSLVGFTTKDSGKSYNIENGKIFNFSSLVNEANIIFNKNFNYFLGGSFKETGLGLTVNVNASKLVVDFSQFSDYKVYIQSGEVFQNNERIGYGFYIGFNSDKPNFDNNTAYATIANKDLLLYTNSKIIAPSSGIYFEITSGWLEGAIQASKSSNIIDGIIIDANNAPSKGININFNQNVNNGFKGKEFHYIINRNENNNKVNYTLVKIGDDSVKINFLNVGELIGAQKISSSFVVTKPGSLALEGSPDAGKTAENIKSEIVYGQPNNIANFNEHPILLHINTIFDTNHKSTFVANGNLGGYNVTLKNFNVINLRNVDYYNKKAKIEFSKVPVNKLELSLPCIGTKLDYKEHEIDFSPADSNNPFRMDLIVTTSPGGTSEGNTMTFSCKNYYPKDAQSFTVYNANKVIFNTSKDISVIQRSKEFDNVFIAIASPRDAQYSISESIYLDYESKGVVIKNYGSSDDRTKDRLLGFSKKITILKDEGSSYNATPKLLNFSYFSNNDSNRYKRDASDHLAPELDFKVVSSLYISITGLDKKNDKTVVVLNGSNKLNITGDGSNNYKVFFVNDSNYINDLGENKNFDTSGYFAILDTKTNSLIYFTGKDITKLDYAFNEFLNGKQNINFVNNYQELNDIINNNKQHEKVYYPTSNLLPDDVKNIDSKPQENSNHSYDWDSDDEEVTTEKADTDKKEDELNNNSFEYAAYSQATKEEDNELLNVLENTDYTNVVSSIKPQEILEFSSNDDINNISSEALESLEQETNNHQDNAKEDILDVINELQSFSPLQEENNQAIESIVDGNSLSNDASTKIEESINKHNSMIGDNHR